jgi:ribosomal protein L11 methyltransferase
MVYSHSLMYSIYLERLVLIVYIFTEPDLLCEFLMEVGACSTSITDADRGTALEEPVFREPGVNTISWNDDGLQEMWTATTLPVWNRCNITAHFPASTDIAATVQLIRDVFLDSMPALQQYTVEQVPNQDWVVKVQRSWTPIVVVNKYVLRFPWHSDKDVSKAVAQAAAAAAAATAVAVEDGLTTTNLVQLQLQGGIAFGTGEHPTTQLCMEWLHGVVSNKLGASSSEPITVLDYGSGSGILGMAACALKPERVTATGIDIDVDACLIGNANAVINQLPMRSYLPPLAETANNNDDESKSLLLKAHHQYTSKQLSERGETGETIDLILPDNVLPFHVGVANILAGPLVSLAPTLARMVQPRAYLGMSGILAHQGDMIVKAYQAAGFEDVHVAKEMGGWILVTAQRSSAVV